MIENALRRAVEARLEGLGRSHRVVSSSPVSGGCIHNALLLGLADGSSVFLKTSRITSDASAGRDIFQREAEGLIALAATDALRIPAVLATGDGSAGSEVPGTAFLLLEAVATGRPTGKFFHRFGQQLADLHRLATADRFGFDHDNYLGATPQPNGWTSDWVDFWAEHRLGHQMRLARQLDLSDTELETRSERLIQRLPDLIGSVTEPPSLLHGDLWSGNFMVGSDGEPVLIDPAAYYGHREAELAMCRLFGGFDPSFFLAYESSWPLEPGARERLDLYQLYHLLNHLNLFGSGYRSQCLAILRRLT